VAVWLTGVVAVVVDSKLYYINNSKHFTPWGLNWNVLSIGVQDHHKYWADSSPLRVSDFINNLEIVSYRIIERNMQSVIV
jgi:hypothetical protein